MSRAAGSADSWKACSIRPPPESVHPVPADAARHAPLRALTGIIGMKTAVPVSAQPLRPDRYMMSDESTPATLCALPAEGPYTAGHRPDRDRPSGTACPAGGGGPAAEVR